LKKLIIMIIIIILATTCVLDFVFFGDDAFQAFSETFTPKSAVITKNTTVRCEAEDTVETAGIKTLTLNNENSTIRHLSTIIEYSENITDSIIVNINYYKIIKNDNENTEKIIEINLDEILEFENKNGNYILNIMEDNEDFLNNGLNIKITIPEVNKVILNKLNGYSDITINRADLEVNDYNKGSIQINSSGALMIDGESDCNIFK
jgi:hypothetical protein